MRLPPQKRVYALHVEQVLSALRLVGAGHHCSMRQHPRVRPFCVLPAGPVPQRQRAQMGHIGLLENRPHPGQSVKAEARPPTVTFSLQPTC